MPVSALVSSATLLTAGDYLCIRFSPSFSYWLNAILLLVSGLSIFRPDLGANFEFDLKRIIALSTLRQVLPMITTISIGLSGFAFFHLLTNALFKASASGLGNCVYVNILFVLCTCAIFSD